MGDGKPQAGAVRNEGGYENEDISLKRVSLSVGAVVLVVILTVVLLSPIFGYRSGFHHLVQNALMPLAPEYRVEEKFAEPRLQAAPRADLRALREREDAVLAGYGWEDRASGTVRVPIAIAMERLLQRGLPCRGGEK